MLIQVSSEWAGDGRTDAGRTAVDDGVELTINEVMWLSGTGVEGTQQMACH